MPNNYKSYKAVIWSYLSQSYKQSTRELASRVGCSRSTVRATIRKMVEEGYPVGSDRHGYWLFNSRKEMQEYLNRLQKVQVALSERIAAAYHAYNSTFGGC